MVGRHIITIHPSGFGVMICDPTHDVLRQRSYECGHYNLIKYITLPNHKYILNITHINNKAGCNQPASTMAKALRTV